MPLWAYVLIIIGLLNLAFLVALVYGAYRKLEDTAVNRALVQIAERAGEQAATTLNPK